MKVCPACRQYCADQKIVCPKCGGSLESASEFHAAHPEQHDGAIAELTAALERDPGNSAARRQLIERYQAQGNWPQVAAHLRVLADADPHDAALQMALVDVLGLAGRGAEAALVLRGLLVKHPDDQALHEKLHDILAWLPLEGLALAHQPPLAELWVEAGDAKRTADDLEAAAAFFEKAHIADERSGAARRLSEVYAQQAADWERQGRMDLALAALESAIQWGPGNAGLEARRVALLKQRRRRRIMVMAGWGIALLLFAGLCIYLYSHRPMNHSPLSAESPMPPSPPISTPNTPAAQGHGHRVTLEISDQDHLAVAQLNGASVLPASKGSFEGSEAENTTGKPETVDLTNRMQPGSNELHFQVRNSGEGGYVRSRFTVRVDDKVVYQKGIDKQDAAEGLKFEDRFTLAWPPTEPAKVEPAVSQDADPFFGKMESGKIATLEISNIDDVATAYLNGQEILSSKWGQGAKGQRAGHQPGSTGVVDITDKLKQGQNELRFTVFNSSGPDRVSGLFTFRVNGRTVYQKGIDKQDSTEGIKFEDRFTLVWPPTMSSLMVSPTPRANRGSHRELISDNGVITERYTEGRVMGSAHGNIGTYLFMAVMYTSNGFKPIETRPNVTCEIKCAIDKTGAIRDIEVKRSTGMPEWDQWAIRAIQQIKMPPHYENVKMDLFPVTFTFDFGP